jgi:hypothetical protein
LQQKVRTMQLFGTLGVSVQANDGVAVALRGDTLTVVYKEPARLHRSRWVYDQADRLVERCPDGIVVLMVVLPTCAPPDGPTRIENSLRLRRLGSSLRRSVTVPVGDEVARSIVRSVVRATAVLQRGTSRLLLSDTLDEGIACLLESASSMSPSFDRIAADVRTLCTELEVDDRGVGTEPPPPRNRRISGIQQVAPIAGDRRAAGW